MDRCISAEDAAGYSQRVVWEMIAEESDDGYVWNTHLCCVDSREIECLRIFHHLSIHTFIKKNKRTTQRNLNNTSIVKNR